MSAGIPVMSQEYASLQSAWRQMSDASSIFQIKSTHRHSDGSMVYATLNCQNNDCNRLIDDMTVVNADVYGMETNFSCTLVGASVTFF